MNAEIYGTTTLTYSFPTEHKTKELAFYNAGFKLDNDSIAYVELTFVNHRGERTTVRVDDWDNKLLQMFDEDGFEVE